MSDPVPARRAGARRWPRVVMPLAALAGGGLMAAAGFLPWFHRLYRDPLTGLVEVQLTGSDVFVALVPLALVVLAGWGAAMLARGWLRRGIGVAIGLIGAATVIGMVTTAATTPGATLTDRLQRPATALTGPMVDYLGPICGGVGGLLALFAGILVIGRKDRDRRRTTRYQTPAAQRDATRRAAGESDHADTGGVTDENGGDWWRALDAGMDPTADDDP